MMAGPPGQPQRPPSAGLPLHPAQVPDPPQQPVASQVTAAPPAKLGDQTAAGQPPVSGGRPAFPGAELAAPSFDDEIGSALSYEKGLAVKALLSLALVALVIALRMYFLG